VILLEFGLLALSAVLFILADMYVRGCETL
jgi:hypothetical protein